MNDTELVEFRRRAEECLNENWPHAWPGLSTATQRMFVQTLCQFAQQEIERAQRDFEITEMHDD